MFADRYKRRKFYTISAIVIFVVFNLASSFVFPSYVYAQPAPVPTKTEVDVPGQSKNIEEQILKGVLSALMSSLVNFASHFLRTLAYDAAVYIAAGGKGEGSLIFDKPFDQYLAGVAGDSAGEAIGALGKEWGLDLCAPPSLDLQAGLKVGLSKIYDTTDLDIGKYANQAQSYANQAKSSASGIQQKGAGALGGGGGGRPQSSCSFQTLKSNWFDESGNLKAPEVNLDMAGDFAGSLDTTETDFGFMLGAMAKVDKLEVHKKESLALERSSGDGFKAVTDLISGQIKTPPALVKEEATALTGKHQGDQSAKQIAGMYASELWQIIPMSASVFLNTLTSELMKNIFTKGLVPIAPPPGSFDFYGVSALVGKRQAAERAFSFLTANTPSKSPENYDISTFYTSCPNPDNPALNECVIDTDFKRIIDIASNGRPLTIYEAIFEENLIDEMTPLISPRRTSDNESGDCRTTGFCYSNIQKLRKARILPLGFEIAALRSDPDNPWQIGKVVKGFEDCLFENGEVVYDSSKPYCHLIDPNWVIRVPDARCEALINTPILESPNFAKRKNECADLSTCITEDKNGSCTTANYFAYCTQEKNVWHLPGDTCPAEYVTCQNFFNETSKENVSYLTRTLDYGSCNVDSVGCSSYSLEQANGAWFGTASDDYRIGYKTIGRNQVVNFNEKIIDGGVKQSSNCSPDNEGCSLFYSAQKNPNTLEFGKDKITGSYIKDRNDKIHLKKAPEYLGCYDTNLNTPEIDWPTTLQQVKNDMHGDEQCTNFAQACVEEEVGCDLYTPTATGDFGIPGVVGGNACNANCVGYETFQQEATNFESKIYPLYFIPEPYADQCSLPYAGCDEFTNIDAVSSGGEGLEYYTYIKRCEKPDGSNSNVYYSWEGSGTEGYVLKVHNLAKVGAEDASYISSLSIDQEIKDEFTANSPAYIDDSASILEDHYAKCNKQLYTNLVNKVEGSEYADDDCRALYGTDGSIYYRLLAETVTVSAACHPLRKTESRLEVDPNIDQSQCLKKKGIWSSTIVDGNTVNACQRCYAGGEWNAGSESCVYNAIDATGESTSCIAEANGCRIYSGNAANNTESVFNIDTFELDDASNADALNMAKEGWSPASVVVSPESLQVGGYSLQINTDNAERKIQAVDVKPDTSYELSFWARGTTQNIIIYLQQGSDDEWSFTFDPLLDIEQGVSIGSTWKKYQVGPVQFDGAENVEMSLVFDRSASALKGAYYIDNVELRRVDEKKYLIKNSWKTPEGYDVPAECFDASQNPAGPFPGVALGCKEYTSILSPELVYTTGFDSLCREEAVGCQPVYDTYNTLEGLGAEETQVFNAKCVNGEYDAAIASSAFAQLIKGESVVGPPLECSKTIAGQTYTCTIDSGLDHCYMDLPVVLPSKDYIFGGANQVGKEIIIKSTPDDTSNPAVGQKGLFLVIDNSSVLIPADTPDDSPLFLTNAPQYRCDSSELGCQKIALEDQLVPDDNNPNSYEYSENFLINNPDNYLGTDGTLCLEEQLSCGRFSAEGQTAYFKDPLFNGHKFCQYLPEVVVKGNKVSGWFLQDGIGQCSNSGELCTADKDKDGNEAKGCGEGDTCLTKEPVPCYPEYFDSFASYGLWSNGTPDYDGYVGLCEPQYNACTEFLDPMDISVYPDGKPYHVLFNNNLTADLSKCKGGQASLREGCVLFDQTDNPTKNYNTDLTYTKSEQKAKGSFGSVLDTLVSPISDNANPTNNNANIVLKVDRDRECSEWLDCKSFVPFELENGRDAKLCYELKACDKTDGNTCTHWVDKNVIDISDQVLSQDKYINRDTSWYGDGDYSGYSIFDNFQITDYRAVSVPNTLAAYQLYEDYAGQVDTDNSYLVYKIPDSYFKVAGNGSQACTAQSGDWVSTCGPSGRGRCVQGSCILPISNADFPSDSTNPKYLVDATQVVGPAQCKAPPEPDSPFPYDVVLESDAKGVVGNNSGNDPVYRFEISDWKTGYNSTHVCQDGECACNYVKLGYKDYLGTVDYWSLKSFGDPTKGLKGYGICSGGLYTGEADDPDRNGWFCQQASQCNNLDQGESQAKCIKIGTKDIQIGTVGHCLEYDLSRPIYGKGPEKFACLTWYPVDVSASNLDIYNIFPDSGFNPDKDAAKGFQGVYCTEATDPVNLIDSAVYDSEEINCGLDGTIHVDPVRHILDPDCDGGYYKFLKGKFITSFLDAYALFAGSSYDKTNPDFEVFRTYSSSIILRIESVATRNIKFGDLYCTDKGKNDGSKCTNNNNEESFWQKNTEYDDDYKSPHLIDSDIDNIKIYNLFPRPYAYEFDFPHEFPDNTNDNVDKKRARGQSYVRSLGTVVYPPRIWDEEFDFTPTANDQFYFKTNELNIPNLSINSKDDKYGDDIETFVDDGIKQLDDANISGLANAPGPHHITDEQMNTVLYRAPFEAVMNEYDLKEVYFIPLSYPGGAQKFNPVSYDNELFIDFNALRTNADIEKSNNKDIDTVDNIKLMSSKSTRAFSGDFDITHYSNSGCMTYIFDDKSFPWLGFVRNNLEEDVCDIISSGQEGAGVVLSYVIEKGLNSGEDDKLLKRRWDITGDSSDSFTDLIDDANTGKAKDPRNDVYRRYVMIFFDPSHIGYDDNKLYRVPWIPRLKNNLSVSGIPKIDVFFDNEFAIDNNGYKDSGRLCYDRRNTNWFAVGMDFNQEGEFLGYLSRKCDDYQATFFETFNKVVGMKEDIDNDRNIWENGLNVAVVATLNNMCTEFIQTFDPSGVVDEQSNKAWTNRVWTESLYANPDFHKWPINHAVVDISMNKQPNFPFGATDLDFSKIMTSDENVSKARSYPFVDAGADGIPYSCQTPFMKGFTASYKKLEFSIDGPGNDSGQDCASLLSVPKLDIYSDYNQIILKDDNFSKSQSSAENIFYDLPTIVGLYDKTKESAYLDLNNIFASFLKIATRRSDWQGESTFMDWTGGAGVTSTDFAGTVAPDGLPPQIYSLNPAKCFPKGDATNCTPGEADNITVDTKNGTLHDYDGVNGPDEDSLNQSPEVIVAKGSYLAHARFFAFADDNRMPIRRVMVDWGDGFITNEGRYGLYKNHKPYCEDSDTGGESQLGYCRQVGETGAPTLITCHDFDTGSDCPFVESGEAPYECVPGSDFGEQLFGDLDRFDVVRFGNTDRACDPNYFEYSNNYNCDKIYQKTIDQAVATNEITQVQADRLFVNSSMNGGDKICVFKPRVQVLDNWGWCNGNCPPSVIGCYNDDSDSLKQQCELNRGYNSFTEFQGAIIVIPTP